MRYVAQLCLLLLHTLADRSRKTLSEVRNGLSYFLKKNGEPDKKMIKVMIYAYFVNSLKQIDIEE
jgi:hypothetical protein